MDLKYILLIMGLVLLVGTASAALDGYAYSQTIDYTACDQDIYQQDIVIHRTTGTAYNETAGGLETWHIYVGEHCREDYGDVRFTNSTGELEYYLWPDYDAESARVCVRLEGADAAGAVTVHYGNPSATTTSSGKDTYLLFDHFEGSSIDTEIWQNTATGGTISVADSVLTISGSLGANKGLQSRASFGPGTTFETSFRGTTATGGGLLVSYGLFRSGNYFSVVDVSSANDAVMFYAGTPESYGNGITMSALFETLTLSRPATSSQRGSYRSATSTFSETISDDLPIVIGAWTAANAATYSFDYALVRTYSATPPAGLSGVTAIAAGWSHSLALKSDGTVVAWGDDDYGQSSPSPGLSGVTAIAAGWDHSLALKSDGTVVAWGKNNCGQCSVPPGLDHVVMIAASPMGSYSLALTADGEVVQWGLMELLL